MSGPCSTQGQLPGSDAELLLVIHSDGFQILSLVYLTAVETADIVDPVPAGNHLSFIVIARTFHNGEQPYFK